jgi:hypothetical protein
VRVPGVCDGVKQEDGLMPKKGVANGSLEVREVREHPVFRWPAGWEGVYASVSRKAKGGR